MKPQKILLPTDFSANARNAIDYAIYLFEQIECTFHILHAFDSATETQESKNIQLLEKDSQQKIKQMLKEVKLKNSNVLHSFKGISIGDSLINAIGRSTINKDVDYIFMGTKGLTSDKEIFLGSNTTKVIQHIGFCPIIVVPENYFYDLPDKIAFATNFEHEYSKVELIPLIELAKLWNSKIEIIRVSSGKNILEKQKKAQNILSERLQELPHEFINIPKYSKISDAIMSYTKKNKTVGMIAMVNYGHSFIIKLIKENVIKRVAFYSEVPLLVFPLIDS